MNYKKILLFVLIFFSILYPNDKKVVMIIAYQNFRDEELFIPQKIFEKNGIKVDIASIKKGIARGMLGGTVNVKLTLKEVKENDYDGIIFVGGIGCESLFEDNDAKKLAFQFYKNKKVIGAICLAPIILANAGILKGKKATCFPSASNNLIKNGAIYTKNTIEIDGNIVTGSGPEVAEKFGMEILRLLSK